MKEATIRIFSQRLSILMIKSKIVKRLMWHGLTNTPVGPFQEGGY
jgi:hypothetical protein